MATMAQIIRYCLFLQFCSFLFIPRVTAKVDEKGELHCKHIVGLTFESLMMKHVHIANCDACIYGSDKSYLPTCATLIVAALICIALGCPTVTIASHSSL